MTFKLFVHILVIYAIGHECSADLIETKPRLLVSGGPSNPTNLSQSAFGYHQMAAIENTTIQVMAEIRDGLQYLFQTKNEWTLPIPGTANAAMEAILDNLLEPGDVILVFMNGYWGSRVGDVAGRLGAVVKILEKPRGTTFSLQEIHDGIKTIRPDVVFIVHGESSVGVLQPLEGIGQLCQFFYDCILIVDAVASVGIVPFYMDDWMIDAVYCNTQKGLGSPVGLGPLSYGPRAIAKIQNRTKKTISYRNDVNNWIEVNYWGIDPTRPHGTIHSLPVLNFYSLRESLGAIASETLETVWIRHQKTSERFYAGIERLGLDYLVPNPTDRLTGTVKFSLPSHITPEEMHSYLLEKHSIEIMTDVGVMRVGLFGRNAEIEIADQVLFAIEDAIQYFSSLSVAN